MSGFILGVDIAKKKFDVALLINGKLNTRSLPITRRDLKNSCCGSQSRG